VLNEARIKDICDSLGALVLLDDPVGDSYMLTPRADIDIECRRVPIGVVGIIYEARPNVTVDAAALCLKTGNAVVLRGGREAALTNKALVDIMKKCLADCDIDENVIGFIEPGENHESAEALMAARGLVDVLIPRGSKRLIDATVANSIVPVIETGAGNCHLYVDGSADVDMAVRVAANAKCSRPAVCNAIETLLVHKDIAADFLPKFVSFVSQNYRLEIRGCEKTLKILPDAVAATELDFSTEYNDFILAVKIVDGVTEAVEHINKYGTGHSEAIITRDSENADYFCNYIDAAAVYVNASTRFTDGFEFGFGAEIGISTQKLHARGPMGLLALTSTKYVIYGDGQIRK
jgi:glutamate-5-semialdehyde dehydrogenase